MNHQLFYKQDKKIQEDFLCWAKNDQPEEPQFNLDNFQQWLLVLSYEGIILVNANDVKIHGNWLRFFINGKVINQYSIHQVKECYPLSRGEALILR